MKTHRAVIYHCVTCGRILHGEQDAGLPPLCCGRVMVKASEETALERAPDDDWTDDLAPTVDGTDLDDD